MWTRFPPRVLLGFALIALAGCAGSKGSEAPPVTEDADTDAGKDVTPPEPRPSWARRAVYYEAFVRSFMDSNGDGKGDLNGLISKLDYLNDGNPATTTDLGVDAIWLMPIFASPSYHGYDTTSYDQINPDYGTNSDFARLCTEAHRRGIKIVLDLVMNHTGSGHPWFTDSASSPTSAHRDWYMWSATDLGWKQPWNPSGPSTWYLLNGSYYYGVFWIGMPDLNYRTQAVKSEMKRIASQWLAAGADGFRLDAARYLVETDGRQEDTAETHAVWKDFAAHVRGVRADAPLIGENWTDTATIARYYGSAATIPGGDELMMSFDFPLANAIMDGVNGSSADGIASVVDATLSLYPLGATDAPFLRNHDMVRTATQFGASTGKIANALAIVLTLPGSPFIYYGEELGLENGSECGDCDEDKRTPMPWDATAGGGFSTGTPWHPFAPGQATANVAAQTGVPTSLLARTRRLIKVHHDSEALSVGAITFLNRSGSVLAYTRTAGTATLMVVHNLGDAAANAGPFAISKTSATTLFADPGTTDLSGTSGNFGATIAARGTGIYVMQ